MTYFGGVKRQHLYVKTILVRNIEGRQAEEAKMGR